MPSHKENLLKELKIQGLRVFSLDMNKKTAMFKRGEIRKQAKSLKSSRLWTAGKQVTTE